MPPATSRSWQGDSETGLGVRAKPALPTTPAQAKAERNPHGSTARQAGTALASSRCDALLGHGAALRGRPNSPFRVQPLFASQACCLLQARLRLPGSFHGRTKLFQHFWLLNRNGEQSFSSKHPPAREPQGLSCPGTCPSHNPRLDRPRHRAPEEPPVAGTHPGQHVPPTEKATAEEREALPKRGEPRLSRREEASSRGCQVTART